MRDLSKQLDATKAVDASSIIDSSVSWKDRIFDYMTSTESPMHSVEDILKNTDPKYTDDNFENRKHCLESQFTYLRKDWNIRTLKQDDKIALLGQQADDKLIPFKNAVSLLK